MTQYSSIIIGTGSFLPEKIISNEELSKTVETTDEWIVSRTGIKQRHVVSEGQTTSDIAFKAAENAIKSANINSKEIDLIIVCTTTPDRTFPSVAVMVQAKLGLTEIPAFDLQAVCSGFIYGLSVADNYIKSGAAKTVLLIGAESMSKVIDWQDRNTCVLFGDGAGAVILRSSTNTSQGILTCKIKADGNHAPILYTDGGVCINQLTGNIKMLGKEVFKHAVDKMSQIILEVLNESKHTIEDINWVIPHQANARILDAISTKLNISPEKLVMTLDKQANTSAATIPLALDHHVKLGRIKENELLALAALGAGLTWGGCLIRWSGF